MARGRELLVAMTSDKFQVVGGQLFGRGLSFDVSALLGQAGTDAAERDRCLTEIAEVIFLQGRSSVLPSPDDRFDLYNAAEVLRAMAVVSGHTPTGDRRSREAAVITRLLHQQGEGS